MPQSVASRTPSMPFILPPVSFLKLDDYMRSLSYVAIWPGDDVAGNPFVRVINPAVPLGREITLNGAAGVITDTIWTKQAGWTISGGAIHGAAVNGPQIFQVGATNQGRWYQVTVVTANITGGRVVVILGGNSIGNSISTNGTFTQILQAQQSNTNLGLIGTTVSATPFTGDIVSFSCKEINIPASDAVPIQLLADGDFETAGTTNWPAGNTAVVTKQSGTRLGGSGSQVIRVAWVSGSANIYANQAGVNTIGQVCRITGYYRSVDGASRPIVGNSGLSGAALVTGVTSRAWQFFDFSYIATTTGIALGTVDGASGRAVEFDDVVLSLDTGIRPGNAMIDADMETVAATGTASAGAATTLTDGTQSWATNLYTAQVLTIVSGTGAGQSRGISSNTATVITVGSTWTVNPDNTSVYQIIPYWGLNNGAVLSKQAGGVSGQCLRVLYGGVTSSPGATQNCLVIGKRYVVMAQARVSVASNSVDIIMGSGTSIVAAVMGTGFAKIQGVFFADNTQIRFRLVSGSAGVYAEFDDITVTEIPPLSAVPVNGPILGVTEASRLLKSITFDGINDLLNLFSNQLNSIFPTDEGSLVLFGKFTGNWTGGTVYNLCVIGVDANNRLVFQKTATNNTIQLQHVAGGASQTNTSTSLGGLSTNFCLAITWSKTADQVITYINNSPVGSVLTGLALWVGNLAFNTVLLGAGTTSAGTAFPGSLCRALLANVAFSAAQISEIAKLGDTF